MALRWAFERYSAHRGGLNMAFDAPSVAKASSEMRERPYRARQRLRPRSLCEHETCNLLHARPHLALVQQPIYIQDHGVLDRRELTHNLLVVTLAQGKASGISETFGIIGSKFQVYLKRIRPKQTPSTRHQGDPGPAPGHGRAVRQTGSDPIRLVDTADHRRRAMGSSIKRTSGYPWLTRRTVAKSRLKVLHCRHGVVF